MQPLFHVGAQSWWRLCCSLEQCSSLPVKDRAGSNQSHTLRSASSVNASRINESRIRMLHFMPNLGHCRNIDDRLSLQCVLMLEGIWQLCQNAHEWFTSMGVNLLRWITPRACWWNVQISKSYLVKNPCMLFCRLCWRSVQSYCELSLANPDSPAWNPFK